MIHRIRTRITASLAILGLLLASLGGAGAAATATAASSHHKAKKHHTSKKKKASGCHIPQGAHHTDNDPDNHGGPSDGDGCV